MMATKYESEFITLTEMTQRTGDKERLDQVLKNLEGQNLARIADSLSYIAECLSEMHLY